MKCQYKIERHFEKDGKDGYELCGKPAKWKDKDNVPICGLHKKQANTFYKRTNDDFRCEPIEEGKQ